MLRRGGVEMNVSIMGATGYAGKHLVKILINHPEIKISLLTTNQYVGKSYDSCFGEFRGTSLPTLSAHESIFEQLEELDIIFLALPHGITMNYVSRLRQSGKLIIDLSGDYRLTKETYEQWYKVNHIDEIGIKNAVYGLSEVYSKQLVGQNLITNPGCYPTATLLGLIPLVDADFIELDGIVIDAKSGVSGAGRTLKTELLYCEVNENLKAYAPCEHRHTPEIERVLSEHVKEEVVVQFTPHLIPMQSGMLTSTYAVLKEGISSEQIAKTYSAYYANRPFIRLIEGLPETRWVVGTNYADIGFSVDERTNRILVFCAIDNTIKGAAGQAVQNMNIALGFKESLGLI
jgi:N-acetyl-gamma-glutamyl-phosphate reductase